MVTPITSPEDLAAQTEVQYGTLLNGTTLEFFQVNIQAKRLIHFIIMQTSLNLPCAHLTVDLHSFICLSFHSSAEISNQSLQQDVGIHELAERRVRTIVRGRNRKSEDE